MSSLRRGPTHPDGSSGSRIRALFENQPEQARRDLLVSFLRQELAGLLHIAPEAVPPRENLMTLGLDSMKAVEFKLALDSDLAISLPSAIAFDHPNVEALADFLLTTLDANSPSSFQETTASTEQLQEVLGKEIEWAQIFLRQK